MFTFRLQELFRPLPNTGKFSGRFSHFLFGLSLFGSIMALYVFSVQNLPWLLHAKRGLMVLCAGTLGLTIIAEKRLNVWYLLLASIVGIYILLTKRVDAAGEFILLSWMLFIPYFAPVIAISRKWLMSIGFLLCTTVAIHFFFFERYGRESIGGLDPNYSGLLVFLIFPFAFATRSVLLHIVIVGLGLLTQSRGFLGATFCYFSCWILHAYFPKAQIKWKHFMALLFIVFVCLISFSYYKVSLGRVGYQVNQSGFQRLLRVWNVSSDFQRWNANVSYLEMALKDDKLLKFGKNPGEYAKKVNKYLPHNLPFLELATHGVFLGMAFLVIYFGALGFAYQLPLLPIFAGLSLYWLFLGVEVGAVYNVYLVNVLWLIRPLFNQNQFR